MMGVDHNRDMEWVGAAAAFVDQLQPQDRVIVIEFHDSVKVQTEATTDREKIYKAIKKAKFGNGTSLYNAVDEALRKQLGKIEGRKAVVLFTDGVSEAGGGAGEMFGETRLEALVVEKRDLPAREMQQAVVDAVTNFSGGELEDDLTLVVAAITTPA